MLYRMKCVNFGYYDVIRHIDYCGFVYGDGCK